MDSDRINYIIVNKGHIGGYECKLSDGKKYICNRRSEVIFIFANKIFDSGKFGGSGGGGEF